MKAHEAFWLFTLVLVASICIWNGCSDTADAQIRTHRQLKNYSDKEDAKIRKDVRKIADTIKVAVEAAHKHLSRHDAILARHSRSIWLNTTAIRVGGKMLDGMRDDVKELRAELKDTKARLAAAEAKIVQLSKPKPAPAPVVCRPPVRYYQPRRLFRWCR